MFFMLQVRRGALAILAENHLLENLQLLVLSGSLFVFGAQYKNSPGQARRPVVLALTLLSFTFLIRECDLRLLGVPPVVTYFTDDFGRYYLLVPLWLLVVAHMGWRYRTDRHMFRPFLFTITGWLLFASAVLVLAGIALDKGVIRIIPSQFYEEISEFNSYVLLLMAAFVSQNNHRTNMAAQ